MYNTAQARITTTTTRLCHDSSNTRHVADHQITNFFALIDLKEHSDGTSRIFQHCTWSQVFDLQCLTSPVLLFPKLVSKNDRIHIMCQGYLQRTVECSLFSCPSKPKTPCRTDHLQFKTSILGSCSSPPSRYLCKIPLIPHTATSSRSWVAVHTIDHISSTSCPTRNCPRRMV